MKHIQEPCTQKYKTLILKTNRCKTKTFKKYILRKITCGTSMLKNNTYHDQIQQVCVRV